MAQATERQIAFIQKLMGERGLDGSNFPIDFDTLTKQQASQCISTLLGTPKVDLMADQPSQPHELEPGVYENEDGVFVVKWNREHTRQYAKRMVEIGGSRLTEDGAHVQIEFDYAAGAVYRLKPEHKMPKDRAIELTLLYGKCINCGRKLKAAKSVEQGIGPVCIKAFAA